MTSHPDKPGHAGLPNTITITVLFLSLVQHSFPQLQHKSTDRYFFQLKSFLSVFLDQELIQPISLVILLFLFLLGPMSSKKPKALLYQIGSR